MGAGSGKGRWSGHTIRSIDVLPNPLHFIQEPFHHLGLLRYSDAQFTTLFNPKAGTVLGSSALAFATMQNGLHSWCFFGASENMFHIISFEGVASPDENVEALLA